MKGSRLDLLHLGGEGKEFSGRKTSYRIKKDPKGPACEGQGSKKGSSRRGENRNGKRGSSGKAAAFRGGGFVLGKDLRNRRSLKFPMVAKKGTDSVGGNSRTKKGPLLL